MTTTLIREATEQDIPAMAGLMTELGYPTTVIEMQQRMEVIGRQTDYKTFVAISGDTVTGMLGGAVCYAWEMNTCYVRIQTLVVSEHNRSKGTGEALVSACENWGREHNAAYLSLNCSNREIRAAAHRFYPRIGFTHTSSGYIRQIV